MKRLAFLVFITSMFFLLRSIVDAAPDSSTSRIAMVVGANTGGFGRINLKYAVADANLFVEVLNRIGGVSRENSLMIFNPDRRIFFSAMKQFNEKVASAKNSHKRVEAIFYYSGHSDEEGILLNGEKIFYKEIKKNIELMRADVKIAILDSCSSGAFTRVKGGSSRSPFLIDRSYDMKGYAFMTSSAQDEASQESEKIRGSFFTYYLISGLRGAADMTQDGRITLNEAYQYAYRETLARTEKTMSGPQHPNYHIQMTGTGDVVLTDIRKSSAGMVLSKDISGRIFVRGNNQILVGEFQKYYGVPLEVSLEPGRYSILNENDKQISEMRITLSDGSKVQITSEKFIPKKKELTAAKGEAVDDGEIQEESKSHYLFSFDDVKKKYREVSLSGYGAPEVKFSAINNRFALLSGGKGGVIINEKFVLGAAGYGVLVPRDIHVKQNSTDEKIGIGYGGFLFEYYLFPRSLVTWSFGMLIGGGATTMGGTSGNGSPMDRFFAFEPAAHVYVNVVRFLRAGVGVSYRYTYGLKMDGLADRGFRNPSIGIVFEFGWF